MEGSGHMSKIGSRAAVMHGNAHHTSGGLTKKDLKYNKNGRIVSVKKSKSAKKEKRLEKAGYKTKKGKFGSIKVTRKNKKSKKGGNDDDEKEKEEKYEEKYEEESDEE